MIVRALALAMLLTVPYVPVPPRDPGVLARAILSDSSRYHLDLPHVRERPKSWLERAWDWIRLQWSRLLGSLFRGVRMSSRTSAGPGAIILFLLAAGLLLLIAKALAGLARGGAGSSPNASHLSSPDVRRLYDSSTGAASRQSLTLALQILFAATIAALAERGITRFGKSATVGDLRREIGSRDASLVAAFDAIAAPFTTAVYAEMPPGEADWLRARDAFLVLWSGHDAAH